MMVKLREWLVSGTFFSAVCFISTMASVGWGLAAHNHSTTFAAAEDVPAATDNWFLQASAKAEMPVMRGLADLPAWDKLGSLYGVGSSQTNVNKPKDILLAAAAREKVESPITTSSGGSRNASPSAEQPDKQTPTSDKSSANKANTASASSPDSQPIKASNESAAAAKPSKPAKPVKTASVSPTFLIYHTHNRESYFPELKDGAKDASSKTVNVTMVGKRLAASLEKLGMPSIHQTTDYPTTVQKFNYAYSYKYSKQTVVEALKKHKDIAYLFDIHRDSQRRDKTTVEINGKDYAKILFVIGERNPNWKDNKKFALKLHEALNAEYPGISRGVLSKGPGTGNAEYNQTLSPGSLVVEMGGVDNTLEESYRTADALASVMKALAGEKAVQAAS